MEDINENTKQVEDRPSVSSAGQNLGIAALITAIVTFVLAVIPCVGIIAIIPGIIAIVLAVVGLSHAARNNASRGLLIAALAVAVIASLISFSQIFVAGEIAKKAQNKFSGDIQEVIRDVKEDVLKEIDEANVSIKIENGNEKLEINTSAERKDRIKELEELEKENIADTLEKPK